MNNKYNGWWMDSPLASDSGSLLLAAVDPARQIVFIDGAVADAQVLAKGVKPGVVAVVLDPGQDELQQIAAYLASHAVGNLAAVDIVAHGSDGALKLGNTTLDAGTIADNSAALAAIGAALQPGGAIQLYGCDVAQDPAGVAFLQALSQAAGGANIAAASHLVGAADGGGSWNLNVDIGAVPAANPFTPAALAAYPDELANLTGSLYLGSWNGNLASTVNQITALGLDGTSVTGTTDIADTTKSGDSAFFYTTGVAVDPARGTVFVLDTNSNTDAVIYSVPIAGGPATAFYTAPDTGANGDPGSLGDIRVDEQNDRVVFTQGDFNLNTNAEIPANSGVFSVPEAGGAATQLVNDVYNGITLDNPTSLALDLPDNLAIFIDNDAYDGGSGNVVIYAGSLTSHQFTALLTFDLGTAEFPNTALAIDPASHTIYYTVDYYGTASSYGIYSIRYTPNGASTTVIGSPTLLYSGSAAIYPDALAVDPANGLLFVSGSNVGNSGSSGIASTWVGSTSGSGTAPLTQIFTLGPQTSGQYAYTGAVSFESAPTIAASGTADYAKGGAGVAVDAGVSLTDETQALLASATVSIASGFAAGDTLAVGNAGGLGTSYSGGVLTLTGDASLAIYQTALDSITFSSSTTTTGSRTIDWTVNDGLIASATSSSTVEFTIPPPVVIAGATANFTGGGAAARLDAGLTVTDQSSSTLASATVSISGFVTGDTLEVGTTGGLGTSYSNGMLTLTGSASLLTYQTALESITYSFNPSDGDPTAGGSHTTRTLSWSVYDGTSTSNTATSTLDLSHVAPTVVAGAATSFSTKLGPVPLDTGLTVSDPDSLGNLASATVSIGGFVSGDMLSIDTSGLAVTGSYDVSTGVMTLTGADTLLDYQAALDSITYSFSGAHPGVGGTHPVRTIDWTANDGVATSGTATSSLAVACYVAGTRIATPSGEVAVETLRAGDLVATGDGTARPVKWIGRRRYTAAQIAAHKQLRPVLIRRDALAPGQPRRDLRVSSMHALFIDDVFIPAAALINGVTVLRSSDLSPVDYVHVELEGHDVIFAEDVTAETFVDDNSRLLFDNADEYYDRFGAEAVPAGFSAPRIEEGFRLEAVRRRLAARAGLSVTAAAAGKMRGHVERFAEGLLQGWVTDEANPAIPVELDVLVDGRSVARVLANRYRTDLDHAGLADGRCAFSLAMPASVTGLGRISVHRAADGMRLPMPQTADLAV